MDFWTPRSKWIVIWLHCILACNEAEYYGKVYAMTPSTSSHTRGKDKRDEAAGNKVVVQDMPLITSIYCLGLVTSQCGHQIMHPTMDLDSSWSNHLWAMLQVHSYDTWSFCWGYISHSNIHILMGQDIVFMQHGTVIQWGFGVYPLQIGKYILVNNAYLKEQKNKVLKSFLSNSLSLCFLSNLHLKTHE